MSKVLSESAQRGMVEQIFHLFDAAAREQTHRFIHAEHAAVIGAESKAQQHPRRIKIRHDPAGKNRVRLGKFLQPFRCNVRSKLFLPRGIGFLLRTHACSVDPRGQLRPASFAKQFSVKSLQGEAAALLRNQENTVAIQFPDKFLLILHRALQGKYRGKRHHEKRPEHLP